MPFQNVPFFRPTSAPDRAERQKPKLIPMNSHIPKDWHVKHLPVSRGLSRKIEEHPVSLRYTGGVTRDGHSIGMDLMRGFAKFPLNFRLQPIATKKFVAKRIQQPNPFVRV